MKDPEFWFSKGHNIQTTSGFSKDSASEQTQENKHSLALNYYLFGLNIKPRHLGCIYNIGCCQYFLGKFENARKWFHLAL